VEQTAIISRLTLSSFSDFKSSFELSNFLAASAHLRVNHLQMNQTLKLKEAFPAQYDRLVDLFGVRALLSKSDRLNEIYFSCASAWNKNIERLRNKQVKYLLIAEAAPWSEGDSVQYFYKTFDKDIRGRPIQWIRSLWKVFYPIPPPNDIEQCLLMLADMGFLLVDSIPFALNYKSYRNRYEYKELVRSCSEFITTQLLCDIIDWSDKCMVALAFKLNGLAVIESFHNGIALPNGQNLAFSETKIAATGSGFPTRNSLSKVWEIDQNSG